MVVRSSKVENLGENTERSEVIDRLRIQVDCLNQIVKMLERDHCCVGAIEQIQLVQSALHEIEARLLSNYLAACIASTRGDSDYKRILNEINVTFCYWNLF